MGCDIHMYIEYSNKNENIDGKKYWRDFGGKINPGRNYFMFGILSRGVMANTSFYFDPKGLPDDIGYKSKNDSRIFISETPSEEYVTLEKAQQWAKSGNKIINGNDGKPTWVEHPDWHSHSWLTCAEFEKVMEFFNSESNYKEPEYDVVLTALKRFDELGFDSRIVFWFDN